ncbi:MAG: SIMPL domain-containing protein [Roseateles asaccharophilus]|uniref:SIMPL domain-containing protein n=1 Tax=Roseateles asaccharophilus TaxID=582607 RepID=UPI00391CE4F5
MQRIQALVLLPLALAAGWSAQAQTLAPRKDALNLSASASQEVTRDTLSVVFSTTREGADAATVQRQLKQALDAALAEARKSAKPGELEVQTGNFSLYPRYAPKGGINGWQGSAELLVQGKDAAAIAQLTGRISSLSIARVGYSLSREAREKAEAEVVGQAIARYKARAGDYARQFGFSGYQIGEVSVNTSEGGGMLMAAPMPRMKVAAAAMAEEALPVEAGKETVSVSVSGVVLMSK